MIRKKGMTLEAALAKIDNDSNPPKTDQAPRDPIGGEVTHFTYSIKADTTQAAQAIQELRDHVQDLQEKLETCTEALARAMNVKPGDGINPLEALFYIADLQKEILAELKAIRANTTPVFIGAAGGPLEGPGPVTSEALHKGGP